MITTYHTVAVDGLNLFYREAGSKDHPTIVLLHGLPSSSHMYRDLMQTLSNRFHLIAPDYPGFGNSDTPPIDQFEYSFDRLAEITEHWLKTLALNRFSLYVQDYGAPIGFRIAARHPEWIQALIVQNGNAYEEGLTPAWKAFRDLWSDRTFYTAGTRDLTHINPDNWNIDQSFLDRPQNTAAQLELFYDYRNNLKRYPQWHEYFRQHQPPTLIVWGKNDPFFSVEGAEAFQRDLPNAELHLLDTGHFALEEEREAIAHHIARFVPAHI
jgi:pimeloyl-ACP methyl ester carboxylesterase